MFMKEIDGKYSIVELRDGSEGNYEVARQHYRDFSRLEKDNPDGFKKLCARVKNNPDLPLTEEHKAILVDVGLAWHSKDAPEVILSRPEKEIKNFICLIVQVKPISRLFSFLSGHSGVDYKLVSPFKYAEPGAPDQVAPGDRIAMEWAGRNVTDSPACKLFPNPGRKFVDRYGHN